MIDTILDQWLTPEGRGFRVITQDLQIFELFFMYATDEWQILQP
jgi:hypothetical protein